MFSSNQVCIRDLFSSHTRGGCKPEPCETALESNSQSLSQLPYSQIENDLGSQYSSQSSDSLGKKFNGLYNHKSSLFSRDSQSKSSNLNPQPGKVAYQQQIQNNKAKAKERDERDLLENVVTFMRECSAEIKTAVSIVKQNVHSGVTTTQESLTSHLEKLQEDLSSHREEMIKALHVRDDMKNKCSELEQTVAAKDAKIIELEKTLAECKEQENRELIKELQHTFHEGCEITKDHITQSYEAHKKELEDICQDQSKNKKEILQQTKHMQRNMMDHSFGLLQEVQNKLQEDLEHQQQSESRARHRLREDLQKELSHTQTQQREEVKALLRQQLQQIHSITDQGQNDVFKQQQSQMEELQVKHRDDLNKSIHQQLCKLTKEQKNFAEALIQDMWEKERITARAVLKEQQKSLQDEMQQSFETQLRSLKEHHEKEVKQILSNQKAEMVKNDQLLKLNSEWQNKYTYNKDNRNGPSNFSHESTDKSKYHSSSKKAQDTKSSLEVTSMFRSPLLTNRNWTSKSLFNKRNPSPVATVHPLVQESEHSNLSYSMKPCTRSSNLVITADVKNNTTQKPEPKPKQQKKKPQKRRRKGVSTKKRKTRKVENSQPVKDTQDLSHDLPDTEDDEDNESTYISNRFDSLQSYKSHASSKSSLTQESKTSTSWQKSSLSTNSQSKMNIYDFQEECASADSRNDLLVSYDTIAIIAHLRGSISWFDITCTTEAKSNTTPADARWYAAFNAQVAGQTNRLSQMRMSSMKSPEISQVDEGCSSVGSSPSYSVVDFMNMLKNKEEIIKESPPVFSASQAKAINNYSSGQIDFLSTPNLSYPFLRETKDDFSRNYQGKVYDEQRRTGNRLQ